MAKFAIVLASLALIALAGAYPWDAEPRPDQWWVDRHNGFVENTENNAANINVLFYGDSITEGWNGAGREVYDEYYAPLGTANYGIGGDQTQHLNWRIYNGEVEGLAPKLTVIKIGTNNIGGSDDNDISAGVLSVVRSIRMKLPNTKILLLGVLPRNNAQLNARVRNINVHIQTIADGSNIRYLDMFETFCKGEADFETHLYTADLLHLSTAGYQAWAETMAPIFNEMMEG